MDDRDGVKMPDYDLKPDILCHNTICYIDRETKAVTAGVNFEDIDLRIEGEGSEVYGYEYHFIVHSSSSAGSNNAIFSRVNNLVSYSRDNMTGSGTSPSAGSLSSDTNFAYMNFNSADHPCFRSGRITGYIGSKRHNDYLMCDSGASSKSVAKYSYYTADTSTEITSMQFYASQTSTITYSLFITAVPKVQYNPNAILLKNLDLTNQTADIIFGGVNDTEGVDDLDGDEYDYYVVASSGLTAQIKSYINENTSSSKTKQYLRNSNGAIQSSNSSQVNDGAFLGNCCILINSNTGRKKISIISQSGQSSPQQEEDYFSNPDTSTPMTSLLLRPSASVSGNVQLYAVPKGYNADLTPWKFNQTIDIAGDFSAGHSFEIPSWACLMKVNFVGEASASTQILSDFNNLGLSFDAQQLFSNGASTTASFNPSNEILGYVVSISRLSALFSLKSGSNRVALCKSSYNDNRILFQGKWIKDSSTVFTTAQIKANNTNTINGKLTVSFY